MSIDTHPPRRQVRTEARVVAAYDLTPRMRRVVFGGATLHPLLELDSTDSAAAWVKVFVHGREGRAYTIRSIDRSARKLNIDFALRGADGDDGSVSAWARSAKPGEVVALPGLVTGGFHYSQTHVGYGWRVMPARYPQCNRYWSDCQVALARMSISRSRTKRSVNSSEPQRFCTKHGTTQFS